MGAGMEQGLMDWDAVRLLWEQRHANVYGKVRDETFEEWVRRVHPEWGEVPNGEV